MKRIWLAAIAASALSACAKHGGDVANAPIAATETAASARLDAVLAAADESEQARFAQRHPKEMLQFFGIEPGMTVAEVLPGGGWWSKLLIPYLGAEGRLIGADYPLPMWALFGNFAPDPAKQKSWPETFAAGASSWCAGDCAQVSGFAFGATPPEMRESVDVVLFFRAMHHFSRFEDDGGYMTASLKETYDILKAGGVVGVEQHRAPEALSDAWADGDAGYVKQSAMIAAFEKAGFVFEGASEMNANPKDQPTESDVVWRLPPSLATSRNDPALKAAMEAIGESDRMTLKFRKPKK
jgi:predicted methyltransferase